ncbi:unnamed protein product [Brassica oleracea]
MEVYPTMVVLWVLERCLDDGSSSVRSASVSWCALSAFFQARHQRSLSSSFQSQHLIFSSWLIHMNSCQPCSSIKAKSLVAYPFNVVVAESSPMDASSGTTSTTSSARR